MPFCFAHLTFGLANPVAPYRLLGASSLLLLAVGGGDYVFVAKLHLCTIQSPNACCERAWFGYAKIDMNQLFAGAATRFVKARFVAPGRAS